MTQRFINAEVRSELGKNASRRLRVEGKVPAVFYGQGQEATSLAVDPKEVVKMLTSDTGRNSIFKLKLGEQASDVMVKEFQLHPLHGNLLHVDFVHISMDEVMEFEVPVEVSGTAKGTKLGGVLDVVLRTIEVECLPRDVPSEIQVEVSELEIGDSLRVADLKIDTSKIKVLSDSDFVVVTVAAPQVEEEESVEDELESAAEPELIRRGKPEEEEE